MIAGFRDAFNVQFRSNRYLELLKKLDFRCGTHVEFRVAETPVFIPLVLMEQMTASGALLAKRLLNWPDYLEAARRSIPEGYYVAGETAHPNFLTADFALINGPNGTFVPRLVEIQAFPSVFAYQVALDRAYAEVFDLSATPGMFLGGLTEQSF